VLRAKAGIVAPQGKTGPPLRVKTTCAVSVHTSRSRWPPTAKNRSCPACF